MTRARWLLRTRYALLATALAVTYIALQRSQALRVLGSTIDQFLSWTAQFGAPGMFIAGVAGNASILVQVPYTLPLLSVALDGATLPRLLVLALACGVGAGVGEIISYLVADAILTRTPSLSESRVYRWIERNTDEHPRLTQVAIFLWAATPLPDDTVIVPLAMINYGVRRIAVPLFAGKVVHNLVMAYAFYMLANWSVTHTSAHANADLALLVIVGFVLLVLYQVESTRLARRFDPVETAAVTDQPGQRECSDARPR